LDSVLIVVGVAENDVSVTALSASAFLKNEKDASAAKIVRRIGLRHFFNNISIIL